MKRRNQSEVEVGACRRKRSQSGEELVNKEEEPIGRSWGLAEGKGANQRSWGTSRRKNQESKEGWRTNVPTEKSSFRDLERQDSGILEELRESQELTFSMPAEE